MSGGPLDRLRYHVTGAIERGEGAPVTEQRDYKALARSLQLIARDHDDAGATSTARDYHDAVRAIDELLRERSTLRVELFSVERERDTLRDRLNRVYREINR